MTACWLAPAIAFWTDAAAARLPDWAKAVAESAPPIAEGVPKYHSQVLFRETRYAVQADGGVKIRWRQATQALSVNAEQIGFGGFHFDDTMKMTASRAWHLKPEGKAVRDWGPPVDIAIGSEFLSDSKMRVVSVSDVKKGSIVFFEFEATDKPRLLDFGDSFYDEGPILSAKIELETPPGWTVRSAWLRRNGPEPVVSGSVRSWELRDIPAPEEEPLSDDPADLAPLLIHNVAPPAGVSIDPATFPTWESMSAWYETLSKGRRDVTPPIQSAAREAAAAAGDDFFAKVVSTGKYVRDKVRYVAIELGIGGYQPHPASETLSNLYGDCKDKATLFQALLASEGISSYPVLINLVSPETVSAEIPGNGFNHLVAAVPVPKDSVVPERFASAVADGGDLGKLLIVDTTDERTSIGSLSADLAGKKGLVVAGDKGKLVTLPPGDPSAHRLERRIRVELKPDRSMKVERASTYTGGYAWLARDQYSSSSLDRRKLIERRVLRIWPDATVSDYAAEYETPEGAFTEKVAFTLRPLPGGGADGRIEMFPGAADDVDRVPLGRRKTPVSYEHPMSILYEMTYAGFPAGAGLPQPQESKGDGWAVATSYSRTPEGIVATWKVTLSRTRFEQEAFPELRRFWSAATSAANWMLETGGGS